MNAKETLKKLHETFPDFDTDTLLKILDCYVEESITFPNTISSPWNGYPINVPTIGLGNITYCQDEINSAK